MYEGKTKRVVDVGDGFVVLEFKDDVTAGNGLKHDIMPGKGSICSEITAILMNYLNKQGILTHFVEYIPPNKIKAVKLKMYPLEVVVRFKKAGSFVKRYGGVEGEAFKKPLLEFFLKDDKRHDPMVCCNHIEAMGIATSFEIDDISSSALKAAFILKEFFARCGLDLWDMKFEYGKADNGKIYLGDEISPDSLRLRKDGKIFDKDVYRRDLGDLMAVYKEVLSLCKSIASL